MAEGGFIQELLIKFGVVPDKKSFQEAESSLDGLVEKAKEFAKELLALEGVKMLAELVMGVAENAERLSLASEELGVGVEALQKYEYAAKLAGVSTGELDLSLRFLLRNMSQASEGSKEASKGFMQLGISVKGANGHVKTVEEALPEIADKFQKIEDPAKRVRIAMELFGRAGARMIPFLTKGSAGLKELGDEAESFGAVLTKDQTEIGEGFLHNIRAIGQFFQGIKNAVGISLIKHLDVIASKMREWMKVNGELVRSRITEFFDALGVVLERVAQLAEPFVDGLLALFNVFTSLNPQIQVFLVLLGGIALAFGIAALGPILLATAIALLVEDIYGYFTGKNSVTGIVVKALDDMFDAWTEPHDGEFFLVSAAKQAAIYIKNIFSTLFTDLSVVLGAFLTGNFADIPSTVKALVSNLSDNLGSFGAIKQGYEASGATSHALSTLGNGSTQDEGSGTALRDSAPTQFAPQITIHASTGATAEDIAGHVKVAVQEAQDEHMRQSYNALVPAAQ